MLTKKSKLLMSVAALGFLLCANAENAKAGALDSVISQITKKLSPAQVKKLCRKGEFPKVISIRSGEGFLASNKIIAAWGEEHCGALSDADSENYKGSKFHSKALGTLGGKTPHEVLEEVVEAGGPNAKAAKAVEAAGN